MDEFDRRTPLWIEAYERDLKLLLMMIDGAKHDPKIRWYLSGLLMYGRAPQAESREALNLFREQQEAHYASEFKKRADADAARGGEDSVVAVWELLHKANAGDPVLRRWIVLMGQLLGLPLPKVQEVIDGDVAPDELEEPHDEGEG